jgi:osmotically inducible lipoprotein OsmB
MAQARADRISGVGRLDRTLAPPQSGILRANARIFHRRCDMSSRLLGALGGVIVALSMGACSDMTHQEKGTVAGAAVGGVAGNVVTGGSTAGTLTGAAVGGVVGHEVTRP